MTARRGDAEDGLTSRSIAGTPTAQFCRQATYTRPHAARRLTKRERAAWEWHQQPEGDTAILAQFLTRWRVDPVLFAFEALRIALMPYQAQILLDLFDAPVEVYAFYGLDPHYPKNKVLVPSGHGLGKTLVIAVAIWAHKTCYRGSKQLVTAPTADQLTGQLMGEIRKLWRALQQYWPVLANDWDVQGAGIQHKDARWKDAQTMLRTARADSPEALQGGHALDAIDPYGDLARIWGTPRAATNGGGMLIVFEEASGIPDVIRQTLQGSLSERNARMLAPGNPTRADGWFAEQIDQPDLYAVHNLDCRMSDIDTEYALPYRPPGRPVDRVRTHGFVSRDYWQGILDACDGDENADYFRVRVAGRKPVSNVTQVIREEWITAAQARGLDPESQSAPVVLGADFGLMSDKHALAAVQGYNCLDLVEWLIPQHPDEQLESAFERIVEWQAQYRARYIVGDSNGVGAGVMSRLSAYYRKPEHKHLHVVVVHFQAGRGAPDKTRYGCLRDVMWYSRGRAFFSSPRCHLPAHPGLKDQLCAPGFTEDDRRVIRVESKKDIKKRSGQPSGNAADALLQTQMVHVVTDLPDTAPTVRAAPDLHPSLNRHFKRLRAAEQRGALIQ